MRLRATSAEYVEAKACLAALQWAANNGWANILIYTNWLNLIKAIKDPQSSAFFISSIIQDIIMLGSSYFSLCAICKTNRAKVSLSKDLKFLKQD